MIGKEEIRKIAALSKLFVTDEQLDKLTREMDGIIAFANTINAAGDAGEGFDGFGGAADALRPDEVRPSFAREDVLKMAGGGEDGYFPVRKRG